MKAIALPEGVPNLKEHFPAILFDDVEAWKVQLVDDTDQVIMTSRLNQKDCCCDMRVHFINSAGCLDALNFKHSEAYQESKSGVWERPTGRTYESSRATRLRQNIITEDVYELETAFYLESELPFLREFANAPEHFIEIPVEKGFDTAGGQKVYVPFLLQDCKIPQKSNEVFEFQVVAKGVISNQRINFR